MDFNNDVVEYAHCHGWRIRAKEQGIFCNEPFWGLNNDRRRGSAAGRGQVCQEHGSRLRFAQLADEGDLKMRERLQTVKGHVDRNATSPALWCLMDADVLKCNAFEGRGGLKVVIGCEFYLPLYNGVDI